MSLSFGQGSDRASSNESFASVPCIRETYLDEEKQIRVLALGGGSGTLLDVVFGDIDTLIDVYAVRNVLLAIERDELTILVARREGVFGSVDCRREA